MFTKMWRNSITVANFKFNYPAEEDFTICCWQKTKSPTPVWLAYRIFLGLYFLATFTYIFCYSMFGPAQEADRFKFFIFLTNWSYTLETVLFCLAGVLTISAFRKSKKEEGIEEKNEKNALPWYYQLFWFIYTVMLTISALVTSLFWIKVYDPVLYPVTDRGIIVHGCNCIFMLIDFALIAFPIRFLHFYCPVVYSLIYLLFSVIYELSGGTGPRGLIPIYKILDWKEKPKQAGITTAMALGVILILHILFSLLSLGKMAIRRKRFGE